MTATNSVAGGFVTAWPDATRPNVSSVNVTRSEETISNHVIMPAGTDGGVRLFTQSGTDLVVDITGWYL